MKNIIKPTLAVLLMVTFILTLSGCGVPKEADLEKAKTVYYDNEAEINELFNRYATDELDDVDFNDFRFDSGNPAGTVLVYHDISILRTTDSIEELRCPFSGSQKGDQENISWEKTVDGNKVHFKADQRKDDETYWQRMYYRVDIEQIDEWTYIFEVQETYPWASIFSV